MRKEQEQNQSEAGRQLSARLMILVKKLFLVVKYIIRFLIVFQHLSLHINTVHLWKFSNGYTTARSFYELYRSDPVRIIFYQISKKVNLTSINISRQRLLQFLIYLLFKDISEIWRKRNEFVRKRRSDFILRFNFWPHMKPREGKSIYELRTYRLHPGKLLEWGKIWCIFYDPFFCLKKLLVPFQLQLCRFC